MLCPSVGPTTPVVDLLDNSSYHLDVSVGENDVSHVAPGQPVDITFDALPDKVYTGTVSYVSPRATAQQGVISYLTTVTLAPTSSKGELRPGMSATAAITVDRHPNVLAVANRAIRTEGQQKVVYVLGARNAQTRVPIQTGISNDSITEVAGVSGDTQLHEGDPVVISTTTTVRTGGIFGGGGGR